MGKPLHPAKSNNITVLKMHGYIERVVAQQIEYVLDAAVDRHSYQIIVDLSEADYLSSSGWGMFIGELKRIRKGGGDLVLAGMQPSVLEIFELLEFHRVMLHYETVDQAILAFEVVDAARPA